MALPFREPRELPVNEAGEIVDFDPLESSSLDPEWDALEAHISSPATSGVPTAYIALDPGAYLDFRSAFDAGDVSNGVTISTRLGDDMFRMLDRILQLEVLPWKTKSDFTREAIWLLLKCCQDKLKIHDDQLLSLMAEARVRAQAKFAVERYAAWREMTENLEIQILFWLEQGNVIECGRAVQSYWDEGSKIVHQAWRDHVCSVLRTHPLVKCAALAAIAGCFLFSSDLQTFTGGWK